MHGSRMMSGKGSRARTAFAAAGALAVGVLGAGALSGCVGYRTVPEQSTGGWPNGTPNTAAVEEASTAALRWAIERVPPPDYRGSGGQFAISPPAGLRQSRYLRMARNLGPDAFPVTEDSAHLPTYFVGAVEVRGAFATIDVLCPTLDRWGDIAYKPYTLDLEGGVLPWRVRDVQAWRIGAMDPPAKYFLPATDEPVVTQAEP
ncbi:MAG: hypothetical protein KDA05_05455 [Phycisphaerales bacterium]|nr:hypothetical protein [Phycisphaerales bacterium]